MSDAGYFYWALLAGICLLVAAMVTGWVAEDPTTKVAKTPRVDAAAPGEPLPKYDREAMFGRPWIDVDGNGCRQRDDILQRDLVEVVVDDDGCKVLSGRLAADPYTGATVDFVQGPRSSEVQIDHIYAPRDAYDDGALDWTQEQRIAFANDPRNLVASVGAVNGSKGSRGPAEWGPRITSGELCPYLRSYLLVAGIYGLEVDRADALYIQVQGTECGALLTKR
jgi:hypothetical protein